jgi:putative transcription factor
MNPLHTYDDTVVLRNKNAVRAQDKKPEKRSGPSDETIRKAKLDAETEELKHNTVSSEVSRRIIQGRQNKKINQKQLAQQAAINVSVVQEYENGKAIPNNQILGKFERILGVKLRGKLN